MHRVMKAPARVWCFLGVILGTLCPRDSHTGISTCDHARRKLSKKTPAAAATHAVRGREAALSPSFQGGRTRAKAVTVLTRSPRLAGHQPRALPRAGSPYGVLQGEGPQQHGPLGCPPSQPPSTPRIVPHTHLGGAAHSRSPPAPLASCLPTQPRGAAHPQRPPAPPHIVTPTQPRGAAHPRSPPAPPQSRT